MARLTLLSISLTVLVSVALPSLAGDAATQPAAGDAKVPVLKDSNVANLFDQPCRIPCPWVAPKPVPAIPLLEQWQRQMVMYGRKHGDPAYVAKFDINNNPGTECESTAWYYDGTRVFYEIQDYTGQDCWSVSAQAIEKRYRDYVLNSPDRYSTPGWRVFPKGFAMNYQRTGNNESLKGLLFLRDHSDFASMGGMAPHAYCRETAYVLDSDMVCLELGLPAHANFSKSVEYALGHMDTWFISKTVSDNDRGWAGSFAGFIQPFYVALTSEALINYYEWTVRQGKPDPRVLPAIKAAADHMWQYMWVPEDASFVMTKHHPYVKAKYPQERGAATLNLLIVPLYGWLYYMTGEEKYQQQGDEIFAAGVKYAYLPTGKAYSQNYRWSMDYVQWRLNIPCGSDKTAPVISGIEDTVQSAGQVVVQWQSDEPSTTQIEYGPTPAYGSSTLLNDLVVTSHSQTLRGLKPGETYHYRVKSVDASGNVAYSADRTVKAATKDTVPPVISNIKTMILDPSVVLVSWQTNEDCTSQVRFGHSKEYGFQTAIKKLPARQHFMLCRSQGFWMNPGRTEHFQVVSWDAEANMSTSSDQTFQTSAEGQSVPTLNERGAIDNLRDIELTDR